MSDFITSGYEKITFKEIALEHLKAILNTTTKIGETYEEAYKNSVAALSDILLPYYDDEMGKAYVKFEKEKEELNKKDYPEQNEIRKIYRELFRQINSLLHRSNYLKKKIYSDDEDDEDEEYEE